jgi:TolA-binding protein
MANYRDAKGKGDMSLLTEKYPKSKLTAEIYWQSGADAYNQKQYKQALDYFRKLVGEFPEAQQVGQAYYYMGESYFNLEQYKDAATTYKNFTANFPDNPNRVQALFRLGVSYFQTEDYGNAVIAFHDTVEADPNGPMARDAMANIPLCYKKMNQPAQAISAYEQFLQRFPNDPQRNKIFLDIGGLNEANKNYEAAVKSYEMIPAESDESFGATVAKAKLYRLMKLPNKELDAYEQLRAKTPLSNETRLSGLVTLAELYQEAGKVDSAIAVYEDIAKNSVNPEWKQAALDRARILRSESK